jgi:hypothetical protein
MIADKDGFRIATALGDNRNLEADGANSVAQMVKMTAKRLDSLERWK